MLLTVEFMNKIKNIFSFSFSWWKSDFGKSFKMQFNSQPWKLFTWRPKKKCATFGLEIKKQCKKRRMFLKQADLLNNFESLNSGALMQPHFQPSSIIISWICKTRPTIHTLFFFHLFLFSFFFILSFTIHEKNIHEHNTFYHMQ